MRQKDPCHSRTYYAGSSTTLRFFMSEVISDLMFKSFANLALHCTSYIRICERVQLVNVVGREREAASPGHKWPVGYFWTLVRFKFVKNRQICLSSHFIVRRTNTVALLGDSVNGVCASFAQVHQRALKQGLSIHFPTRVETGLTAISESLDSISLCLLISLTYGLVLEKSIIMSLTTSRNVATTKDGRYMPASKCHTSTHASC